jgi:hypothetical protein
VSAGEPGARGRLQKEPGTLWFPAHADLGRSPGGSVREGGFELTSPHPHADTCRGSIVLRRHASQGSALTFRACRDIYLRRRQYHASITGLAFVGERTHNEGAAPSRCGTPTEDLDRSTNRMEIDHE